MADLDATVTTSLRAITSELNKSNEAAKRTDETLKKLTADVSKLSAANDRAAASHVKAGTHAQRHERELKKLDTTTQQWARSLTAAGGPLATVGGRMATLSSLTPKAIAMGGAVAGLALAFRALAATETRKLEDLGNIFDRVASINDAKQGNALSAGAMAGARSRDAFLGVDQSALSEDVAGGNALGIDDAREAHRLIQSQVAPQYRDQVRAAAGRAVRAGGAASMSEAVQAVVDSSPILGSGFTDYGDTGLGGKEALRRRLGSERAIAAVASGVSPEDFEAGSARAAASPFAQAAQLYRQGEGQRQLTVEAQVTGDGVKVLAAALKDAVSEVVNPGSKASQRELERARAIASEANPILEVARAIGGLFGGEGSKRSQADRAHNQMRAAYAQAQGY